MPTFASNSALATTSDASEKTKPDDLGWRICWIQRQHPGILRILKPEKPR